MLLASDAGRREATRGDATPSLAAHALDMCFASTYPGQIATAEKRYLVRLTSATASPRAVFKSQKQSGPFAKACSQRLKNLKKLIFIVFLVLLTFFFE